MHINTSTFIGLKNSVLNFLNLLSTRALISCELPFYRKRVDAEEKPSTLARRLEHAEMEKHVYGS